jgi:hypothetical protein
VIKKVSAGGEKFGPCGHSPDPVFKVLMMPLHNVNEVFFHFLNMLVFDEFWNLLCGFIIEPPDVFHHHFCGYDRDFRARE